MNRKITLILSVFGFVAIANGQTEINPLLKENLKGIWASDEYRETLFRTNSVTKTLKEYTFYTDIVFDEDTTLHCNRPDFMEENYCGLQPDSTVIGLFGEADKMKIISAEKNTLIIRDNSGKSHSFTRIRPNVDLESIYLEISAGNTAIENAWLKGKYTFESKSNYFELVINGDGTVISDQNIQKVSIFSYMGEDLLCFIYADESYKEYAIKSCSETEMKLQEIKELYEEDQPIKYTRKVAVLRRK